ncbi:PEGA domain-containing protein [Anaerotignum lactatifermentans]|uniref:PEGA domain-containing protein n=1 Tax=Anaerotignum lactatifermentans TaxID=160404 RepID=A0ABS2G708_9FIRM|nr:PEGA domain-containing protein [Anaerotignum lactatifermentans]MBM6829136.1 PEGA domain-containing protein [Anaerotignum lactatifermentans]MBM6877256.1 PEGA domain-containing protein [Anaerotignum lactatifermentans]MBM6950629.1 PEGA domain-containing protein [Anaerotignum lactatifermentans]
MKDYHFENKRDEFDTTIRLDHINEKLKDLENELPSMEDELGDKDDFLNAFESEKFDDMPRRQPQRREETLEDTRQRPRQPENAGGGPDDFWNKKTIGLLTGGGVLLMLIVFLLVKVIFFGGFRSDAPVTAEGEWPMLVESVLADGELLVYDITAGEQKTVTMTAETILTDRMEAEISADEVAEGDLLVMQLDQTGEVVIQATYGGGIFREEVTGLEADTEKHRLTGEKEKYDYDERTMFLYDGESISPEDLEPCDVLELSGIQDTVWSVNVLEYHGYIKVDNKTAVKNGTFRLDEEDEQPLDEVERIAVSEGSHTITVEGDNIETRKDTVFVEAGEEYVYDLSKAQEKVGVLVINANVTDYKLYINGAQTDSSVPAVLPLGEYDVVILKNGYQDWNQKVVLDKDTVSVTANLEREVQYGTVVIASDVEGTVVYVDGQEIGIAPLQTTLTYGEHMIVLRKEGYPDYEHNVSVETPVLHLNATM